MCSSSCFLTAFNKLFFLRERVRVLNPKKRQLFFLSLVFSPLYARAKRRQTTVLNTTPSRAFGKEERDEDSLENTVRLIASFLLRHSYSAFVFLSQISLCSFCAASPVFSNPDWFSLSCSFSPMINSDADSFDALFSLSVCVFLSLMCAQINDEKQIKSTERRKSSRLKFRTLRKRLFCSAKNWRSKGNRHSARKPIS